MIGRGACTVGLAAVLVAGITISKGVAGVNDDIYDGNIFSLYGFNGGLASPRITLRESIRRSQPAFVALYVNDSRDSKRQAVEITRLQSRFGQLINFIAVNVDALPLDQPELQKYYSAEVPRLLLFDGRGRLVYESTGYTPAKAVEPYFQKLLANLGERPPNLAPLETPR